MLPYRKLISALGWTSVLTLLVALGGCTGSNPNPETAPAQPNVQVNPNSHAATSGGPTDSGTSSTNDAVTPTPPPPPPSVVENTNESEPKHNEPAEPEPLQSEPIAYWPFDEGVGERALEDVGSMTAGVGGGRWRIGETTGAAVHLTGGSFVTTQVRPKLERFTISAQTMCEKPPGRDGPNGPISRWSNFGMNWHHPDDNARGAAQICIHDGSWHMAHFGELQANTWYHLAATYDGESLCAYVNGRLVAKNEKPSGKLRTDEAAFDIGRNRHGNSPYDGFVRHVRIFDRALSPGEMLTLHEEDPLITLQPESPQAEYEAAVRGWVRWCHFTEGTLAKLETAPEPEKKRRFEELHWFRQWVMNAAHLAQRDISPEHQKEIVQRNGSAITEGLTRVKQRLEEARANPTLASQHAESFAKIDNSTKVLEKLLEDAGGSSSGSRVTGEFWTHVGDADNAIVSNEAPILVEYELKGLRATDDRVRTVWNLQTGEKLGEWKDKHATLKWGISSDGTKLVSAGRAMDKGEKSEVIVWELPTGKVISRVDYPPDAFYDFGLTPDAGTAFFFAFTQGMYELDTAAGTLRKLADRSPHVSSATLVPATGEFIAGDNDFSIYQSVQAYLKKDTEPRKVETEGRGSLVSRDGRWLAGTYMKSVDGKRIDHVVRHDLKSGNLDVEHSGGGKDLSQAVLTPDGRYLAADAGGDDVLLFDFQSEQAKYVQAKGSPIAVTPGGAIVMGHVRQKYVFLDPATGEQLPTPLDAKWLAVGGSSAVASSESTGDQPAPSGRDTRVWTSADGKFSIEAELVKVIGKMVFLKRKDGSEIQVPMDKLSEDDVKFIRRRR